MEGWISLHRKLMQKAYYSKDSEKVHLWIHLLMKANHDGYEEMLGGKPLLCKPGQFTTGRKQLSSETGISESKIERILTYFEKIEQQIEQQKSTTNRLISILNWAQYQQGKQQNEQRPNNDRTHSNNDNNDNNTIPSVFYKNELAKSDADSNYKKFIDILYGKNSTSLPLKNVLKMDSQVSFEQFKNIYALKEKYGIIISDIFEEMENWGNLKKNKSAYLTFRTFLKTRLKLNKL